MAAPLERQRGSALEADGTAGVRRDSAAESLPALELSGRDFRDHQIDLWQRTIRFQDTPLARADNMLEQKKAVKGGTHENSDR